MILIRCWRCGIGPFTSSHGEGRCEITRIPTSDWIQFEPLKTTQPLPTQLRDVQPAQGEAEAPEGVSKEGEGNTTGA